MASTDVAASIRQRLLNLAKDRHEDFGYVLIQYVMQRLLYRLSVSEFKHQFLLKGALLFSIWNVGTHRPTRDVDFLCYGEHEVDALVLIFKQICTSSDDEADGLEFDIGSIHGEKIIENAPSSGIRITGKAVLAKAKIPFQVDIGFGDVVTPEAEYAILPCYLELPAPSLKVYPVYTVVAEKFHAMVVLDITNSRMKDFYDIWFLSCQLEFDGQILATAIQNTFKNRATQIPKLAKVFTGVFNEDAQKQIQWKAFLRKSQLEHAPEDLKEITQQIQAMLQPLVTSLLQNKSFTRRWLPGGPWT